MIYMGDEVIPREKETNITLTKEECLVLLAYANDYVPVITEQQRDIYRNLMYRMELALKG